MQKEEGIKAKSGCPATNYNWYNARKKPHVSRTQVPVTRYRTANGWQFFQSIRHRFHAFLDPF